MTTRGLKRLCGACGTKYYDFGKLPIKCPSCGVEFTGEVVVKTRRKSSIVADTVKRDARHVRRTFDQCFRVTNHSN